MQSVISIADLSIGGNHDQIFEKIPGSFTLTGLFVWFGAGGECYD